MTWSNNVPESPVTPGADFGALMESQNAVLAHLRNMMSDVVDNPESYASGKKNFSLLTIYKALWIPAEFGKRRTPEGERYVEEVKKFIGQVAQEVGLEPVYGYANTNDNDVIQFKNYERKVSIPESRYLAQSPSAKKWVLARVTEALKNK